MKKYIVKYKKLFLLIISILLLFCVQTIAYSAINGTMTLKGNAYARVETDVRITDFRLASTNNATSSYEEFGKNHIITEVNLTNSSSSIKYYVEITNYGSTDMGIFDITGLPSGVNYSIKDYNLHDKICDDTGKCNSFIKKTYELTLTTISSYSGQVQLNFDFRTYHKVTYTDITNNNYPTEVIDGGTLNITFKENLKRVTFISNETEIAYYQSISNGQNISISNVFNELEVKIKPPVAKLMNGSLTEVGSEVCIKDECFYIISNDGTKVSMLAKYNLYVGGIYDNESKIWTKYGEEATGIQNPNMRGFFDMDSNRQGTTEFSNDENKGNNNNDYIGSLVEKYIKEYNQYLSNLTEDVITTRLITKEELVLIGCDLTEGQCNNNHNWILHTSYWTMSPGREDRIYYIHKNNYFYDDKYTTQNSYGVRPVIEISVDEIYVPIAKLVNGNIGEVGSEVCIGDECFYTISSTDETVTMLAKYNLYVGGVYDKNAETWTAYGNEATGKQDSNMLGYVSGKSIRKGTITFSNTNYWANTISSYPSYVYNQNSLLYNYIENYKTYLSTLGVKPKEARLITYDELTALGCTKSNSSCKNAPSWVYTTSYWSGWARDDSYVWRVSGDGAFGTRTYDTNSAAGVRPVITIPKKAIRKTFDFTVDGTTYKAEENMTWESWINSPYNTAEFTTDGIYVYNQYDIPIGPSGYETLDPSGVIDPSIDYTESMVQ